VSDIGSKSQLVGKGTCVAARSKHWTRGKGGGEQEGGMACEGAVVRD